MTKRFLLLSISILVLISHLGPNAAHAMNGLDQIKETVCQKFMEEGSKEGSEQEISAEQNLLLYLKNVNQQIKDRLSPLSDPFVAEAAFAIVDAVNLMNKLSWHVFSKEDPSKNQLSSLGHVRRFVNGPGSELTEYNDELKEIVEVVYKEADALFKDPNSFSRWEAYKVHLALELLMPTIYRVIPHVPGDDESTVDAKIEENEKSDKEKKDKKEKEEDEEEEEEEPQLQDMKKDYDPETNDISGENSDDNKKKKPWTHISIEGDDFAYFKQANYNVISRNGSKRWKIAEIPMLQPDNPRQSGKTVKGVLNLPESKLGSKFALFVPSGYRPVPSDDYDIIKEADGSYSIKVHSLKSVPIEYVEEKFQLNPIQEEFFKTPVGVDESEWTDAMKAELFPLLKDKDPVEAARLVESFIRNRVRYSVTGQPEKDMIDALNAGLIQCDMAAYIMVALLRDYLKIPSRLVGGLRAKANGKYSEVQLPGEGHAWVEVFHNGRVYTFDPTPKVKNQAQEGGTAQESDRQKDFDDDTFENTFPEPEEEMVPSDQSSDEKSDTQSESDSDSDEASEGSSEGSKEDEEKEGKGAKADEEGDEVGEADGGSEGEGKEGEQSDSENEAEEEMSSLERNQILDELRKELQHGNMSLKEEQLQPLMLRALKVAVRVLMSPSNISQVANKAVHGLRLDPLFQGKAGVKLFNEVEQATLYKQEKISDALLMLSGKLRKQPINRTYRELLQLVDRLNVLHGVLPNGPTKVQTSKVVYKLTDLLSRLHALTSKNDSEIALVDKFASELPPSTKNLFLNKYGIKKGSSAGYSQAAGSLIKGTEMDTNLIRLLMPISEFLMTPDPSPSFHKIRTIEVSRRSRVTPIYEPYRRLSGAQRGLKLQRDKSIIENLKEGTLYMLTRHREAEAKKKGKNASPKRVTIVQFDTSGSMSGPPHTFQKGLIETFVDRASSEVSPSGEHLHQVQLMGFDTAVHTTESIRNKQDAINFLRNSEHILKNTSGGTDIQAALVQAFAAILAAQEEAGEPLANANILLMTDGQSPVDIEIIKKMRAAIDERTPVKIMFVAINGTNPGLAELCHELERAGIGTSMYREYDGEAISEYLDESKKRFELDRIRDFHTTAGPETLPRTMETMIDEAYLEARELNVTYADEFRGERLQSILEQLDRMRGVAMNPDRQKSYVELTRIRDLLHVSQNLKGEKLAEAIAQDVVTNTLENAPKGGLTQEEIGVLKAIVNIALRKK